MNELFKAASHGVAIASLMFVVSGTWHNLRHGLFDSKQQVVIGWAVLVVTVAAGVGISI